MPARGGGRIDREVTMTDPQDDSVNPAAPVGGPDMTVAEMRAWLRNWVGNATG